jgi:photosystem II stability/assembly factor-like uncharacterized protein
MKYESEGAVSRRGLLAAGCAACLPGPASAAAAPTDLLLQPSPVTARGDRKLLTDIAAAGGALFAVGEMGLVLRSDNSGATWTQQPSPTSVMLSAVHFVTASDGWIAGHDGVILATRDGGRTWKLQFDGRGGDAQMLEAARALSAAASTDAAKEAAEDAVAAAERSVKAGPSRPLMGVRFLDQQAGFACGAFGQLFETNDAGERWRYIGERLSNPDALHLNGVFSTPEGEVLVAGEAGTVFRSRDRGQSWTRSEVGYRGYLYGILALPGNVRVAYGFKGNVFRSADGGDSWKPVIKPTAKTLVAGITFGDQAVLLDEDGQILLSLDGGQFFRPHGERLKLRRLSSFAHAGNNIVGVGAGGVAVRQFGAVDRKA